MSVPYDTWLKEARTQWDGLQSGREWKQWLKGLAFQHLERAWFYLASALPEDAGENAAVEKLIEDLERYFWCPPTYSFHGGPGTEVEDRVAALRRMPYSEYLSTAEWIAARESALVRANHRCLTCNREVSLEVHHRTYERRGEERLTDLIALCTDCHRAVHNHGGAHRPRKRP